MGIGGNVEFTALINFLDSKEIVYVWPMETGCEGRVFMLYSEKDHFEKAEYDCFTNDDFSHNDKFFAERYMKVPKHLYDTRSWNYDKERDIWYKNV